MRVREFAGDESQAARLAALAKFLAGRAQDSGSSKSISTQTFINLAQGLGISITDSQLRDMIQQPPLNGIIDNVEGGADDSRLLFRGAETVGDGNKEMTPDQARYTVDNMAKRAAKKDL